MVWGLTQPFQGNNSSSVCWPNSSARTMYHLFVLKALLPGSHSEISCSKAKEVAVQQWRAWPWEIGTQDRYTLMGRKSMGKIWSLGRCRRAGLEAVWARWTPRERRGDIWTGSGGPALFPEVLGPTQRILDLLGLGVVSWHHDGAGTAASSPATILHACEVDRKEGSQREEGPRPLCFPLVSSSDTDNK